MRLKNLGRYPKEILTRHGLVRYERTVLKPTDEKSAGLLEKEYGAKSVVPLDCVLGLDGLPFKVTTGMMLEISKRAIESRSYDDARKSFMTYDNIEISTDQIKKVADYVGGIVFRDDCKRADEARAKYAGKKQDRRKKRRRKNDVLYIETDGAMVNTREKSNGSSWRENKLATAFSSEDISAGIGSDHGNIGCFLCVRY